MLLPLRVTRDEEQAYKWLRVAAKAGLPKAQLQLAVAYETGGWGRQVKFSKALEYAELAGHQGEEQAQLMAARMHM